MPELRELKKKDAPSPSRNKSKKLLIGLLSLLVLVLLFVFFREKTEVRDDIADSGISPLSSEEFGEIIADRPLSSPADQVSGESSESENLDETPPAGGEIRIGESPEEAQNPPVQEEKIVPIPKEELAFFEPLRKQQQESPLRKPVKPPPEKTSSETEVLYTIQLGAFKNKKGADALAIRLRKGGYEAYLLAENGQLYKVRVGEFPSKSAAKKVASQIRKTERLDAFITLDD